MIKKTITYINLDGVEETSDLYFNLTKTELLDHLDLADQIREIDAMIKGDAPLLRTDEMRLILSLLKKFIKLAYGVRSDDGKRFLKSDELWEHFRQTPEYDAFLFSMFEDPASLVGFLNGIMPADLMARAAEQDQALEGKHRVALEALDSMTPDELRAQIRRQQSLSSPPGSI